MNAEENRQGDVLLSMHRFYTEEARHQRSMMWETVKWFTPVLVAIHGSWWWVLLSKSPDIQKPEIWYYLIVLGLGGIILSIICLRLLKSFYRTNLIYITMFAKVEDELSFDRRTKKAEARGTFSADDKITYTKYTDDRKDFEKDENFKESLLKRGQMYLWMKSVFHLFILGSLAELLLVFLKMSFGKDLQTSQGVWSMTLLSLICLAFWLKVIALPALTKEPLWSR